MKITVNFLKKHGACSEGIAWFLNQSETDAVKLIEKLIKERKFNWAGWGIARLLSKLDCMRYAVFAAELALPIFEKKYPDDNRSRAAIQSVKDYLNNSTKENANLAAAAADTAAAVAAVAAAVADTVAAVAVVAAAVADADAYYDADADAALLFVAAANAARSAAYAAYAAAADSAYIVHANVANVACYAAKAAKAADVTDADADAADIAYVVAYKKILNYGLSLLGGKL